AQRGAAVLAGRLGPAAKWTVPALTDLLAGQAGDEAAAMAAWALGRMGPAAAPARAALAVRAAAGDFFVRCRATFALQQVAPESSEARAALAAAAESPLLRAFSGPR